MVAGHLTEKGRQFVYPEKFLCLRVRVSENTFNMFSVKRSFGQVY